MYRLLLCWRIDRSDNALFDRSIDRSVVFYVFLSSPSSYRRRSLMRFLSYLFLFSLHFISSFPFSTISSIFAWFGLLLPAAAAAAASQRGGNLHSTTMAALLRWKIIFLIIPPHHLHHRWMRCICVCVVCICWFPISTPPRPIVLRPCSCYSIDLRGTRAAPTGGVHSRKAWRLSNYLWLLEGSSNVLGIQKGKRLMCGETDEERRRGRGEGAATVRRVWG